MNKIALRLTTLLAGAAFAVSLGAVALSQGSASLTVTSSPPLYVGQSVAFRFTYPAAPNIAAAVQPALLIDFGDGSVKTPLALSALPGTPELSANASHVYPAPSIRCAGCHRRQRADRRNRAHGFTTVTLSPK